MEAPNGVPPRGVRPRKPITPAPQWMIDLAGKPRDKSPDAVVRGPTLASALPRALAYLESAPVACAGQNGNDTTLKVAEVCGDLGMAEPDTLELMADHWNARCEPPWTFEELETIVCNAYKYRKNPQGILAPENAFTAVPSPRKPGFALLTVPEILARQRPLDWLLEGHVERNALGVVFGDPGSYKSFLAIDWALSVATGTPWQGHPTHPGAVVYLAGEGHSGLARRLQAWSMAREVQIAKVPFLLSAHGAQLFTRESAREVQQAIKEAAKVVGPPALVVVDTLARNFGGDENSTVDMSTFIGHLDQYLRQPYQCTVLLIHHTGHGNKDRARGAMALRAAVDFEFRMERADDRVRLTCTKQKDAEPPAERYLVGEKQVIGVVDEKIVDSLVFRTTNAPPEPKAGTNAALILRVFRELMAEKGAFDEIDKAEWRRAACANAGVLSELPQANRVREFNRCCRELSKMGCIRAKGTRVSLTAILPVEDV